MGVLALGMTSLFRNQVQSQTALDQLGSKTLVRNTIQTVLYNSKACVASFANPSLNDSTVNIQLKNSAGVVILQPGVAYKGIKITELTAHSGTSTDNVYMTELKVKGVKVGATANGVKELDESFLINLVSDDGSTVDCCLYSASASWPFPMRCARKSSAAWMHPAIPPRTRAAASTRFPRPSPRRATAGS